MAKECKVQFRRSVVCDGCILFPEPPIRKNDGSIEPLIWGLKDPLQGGLSLSTGDIFFAFGGGRGGQGTNGKRV